jgi:thermitase
MLISEAQLPKARIETAKDPNMNVSGRQSFPWDVGCEGDNEGYNVTDYDDMPTRLIVGFNASKGQDLIETVKNEGANVSEVITVKGKIQALAVDVPCGYALFFAQKLRNRDGVNYVEPDARMNASQLPNDPSWPSQWGPKKIEADWAWNTTIGSSDILVAIVDTGIDYTHEDITPNYLPLGYDWTNNDSDPMDDHGHGTHCAGIVAAKLNNGVGIAGLAQVRLLAEKVLTGEGWGYDSWVAQGVIHATDQGANIISMSLGGSYSALLGDAVKYAQDNGVLVVAAAGNDDSEGESYPAGYDKVMAVSATDASDNLAWFSNFGDWIDIAAPGVDVYSSILDNSYASWSGTSMACPHVAGVAALAWSVYPSCTADQIALILENTADDLGEVGFDEYFGHGRVNARKAVGLLEHDLGIVSWLHASRLDPGQLGRFNATVMNYGTSDEANVVVQFFVNGSLIDSATIDFIDGFCESKTVNFSWDTTTLGSYNVTCYVVSVPDESSIWNNVASGYTAIRFPIIWHVPSDYSTIKAAVNAAMEGDTIYVNQGNYSENEINLLRDSVTLVANGTVVVGGGVGTHVFDVKANFVTINGFTILKCKVHYIRSKGGTAVRMKGYSNAFIGNNIVGDAKGGGVYRGSLYVRQSSECNVSMNNVTTHIDPWYNWMETGGMFFLNCANCTINQNTITEDSRSGGIHIAACVNMSVSLNTLTGGIVGDAIQVNSCQNIWVTSNNLVDNGFIYHSLGVYASSGCTISMNNVTSHKGTVHLYGSTLDAAGIYVEGCSNCTISQNMLWGNSQYAGLRFYGSFNNTISFNIVCGGIPDGGLQFDRSQSNMITSNNITDNRYGLVLEESPYNVLRNNVMANNTANLRVRTDKYHITNGSDLINDVDASNMVNGKPIYYWVNETDRTIPADAGCVILVQCRNITIEDLDLNQNSHGVLLVDTHGTQIKRNNIRANWGDDDENSGGIVALYNCSGICASLNNITQNLNGVVLSGGTDNMFYNNNFLANNKQALIYDSEAAWDFGFWIRGNYWSDYTGIDNFSGPEQDQLGSDGIGDTSHFIDGMNADNYPLMETCPIPNLPDHDMTVAGWTHPYAFVPRKIVTFSARVYNHGTSNEADIQVQFIVNGTLIDSTIVDSLNADTFAIVTFTWDTTIVGNYNVTCNIIPVLSEDAKQNNALSSTVHVRFPATLHVPNDYSTIKGALKMAMNGDTISVDGGYYAENYIGIAYDNVTLAANGQVTLDGGDAYCLLEVRADFVNIHGFTLMNSSNYGVKLKGYGITLTNNTILHNRESLYVSDSTGCVISKNMVHTHSGGIYIINCSNCMITQNMLVADSWAGGMHLTSSSNNTVSMNIITGGVLYALDIVDSQNNLITLNSMIENTYGVYLFGNSENRIFSNNFINNSVQAFSDYLILSTWDNGYPLGGNYWSNYQGQDLYGGPYQNETSSDGIGDTPYIIDPYNKDNYPLMSPSEPPTHDIAVNIAPHKTVIGQGYCTKINVTVENQGTYTENFNVTVYSNSIVLSKMEVTLTRKNSTTITVIWDTSAFNKGNYTISAYATPVLGETEAADNTSGCLTIVSTPGDLNGDSNATLSDLVILAMAYSKPLMPPPDPRCNADIDDNGQVGLSDLVLLARNYEMPHF